MDENGVTAFGGIVGRVLRDAMSFSTAVTAFVLGGVALIVSLVFNYIGGQALSQLVVQVIVAVALARFTLNGLSGEFRGTILSTAGGSWSLALAVAARYLVLNLIWMAPMGAALVLSLFAVWHADPTPGGMPDAPTAPVGGLPLTLPILAILSSKLVLTAAIMLLFGVTILPPILLIVAVRAESFGQIFSPPRWRAAFAGRFADLYAIYAIHAGGIGMMVIVAIPIVVFAFTAASEFGMLFTFMAFAYMCALAITLLGRLCGFFAFGEEHLSPVHALPPAGGPEAPEAAVGFTPRVVHGGAAATGAAGAAFPTTAGAPMAAAPPGVAPHAAPAGDVAAGAAEPATGDGRPPLPDMAARVAAARTRFATDRDGAIAELKEMHTQHAPSAAVVHALALCLREAGSEREAIEMAREALPLCLAEGQITLAAEVFAAFWKQAKALGLQHEQIDAIASVFMKSADLARAVSAYGLALTMDPSDRKAVKGLLQAADQRLYKEGRPKDAAKIYTFLLQYAPQSPFAEDMRRGLAEAESRLARAS
jgi:hypothetical protein